MSDNYYNSLYPKPKAQLADKFRNVLNDSKTIRIATQHDFGTGNEYLKPIIVKNAIRAYQTLKCTECTGSHQFIIAGGYASYLAGLTNCFTDIDVFIDCRSKLKNAPITKAKYKITTHRNVSTLSWLTKEKRPAIQFIQVNFDIGVEKEMQATPIYRDMMTLYILAKFDMPICRVAVKFPLDGSTKNGEIINLAAINFYGKKISEERMMKYQMRKTSKQLQPPSLKIAALFSIVTKFC